jgi:ribosomal protein L16 Arg81 hydroxylase
MTPQLDIIDGTGSGANFAFGGFASLLAPMTSAQFFGQYWERAPFLIKRAQVGYFSDLFTLADVDQLIGHHLFRENEIRIAKDGALTPFSQFSKHGAADRNAILRAYGGGATVVFEHLNRHHVALGKTLAQCETELQVPLRANSYLTPARSKGFSLHYDTHDVMVLQVVGSKTWQIYSNPLPLPHEEQTFSASLLPQAVQIAELTLEPGDVLYLPRGFIHGASSNAETSLHLTIGIRSLTLRDVAINAVKHAALAEPALRQVARFRGEQRQQAIADTRTLLHEIIDRTDMAALFDDVLYSFIKKRTRPMEGKLLALSQPPTLCHASRVRLQRGCLTHLLERAGKVSLVADGKVIAFPDGVQQALRLIQQGGYFCARDLPGMEYESRLILVRKLHVEGLLELDLSTDTEVAQQQQEELQ